jgi:hypothetical protein
MRQRRLERALPWRVEMNNTLVGGLEMRKLNRIGAGVAASATAIMMLAGTAAAQMVPNSVDPYELAPKNVHLYPVSIDARMPYYYLPPIYAPRPMWRGALTAEEMHAFTPHNFVAYEVPDSTALACWGLVKGAGKKDGGKAVVMESANQQQFLILPPKSVDDGSSYMLVTTSIRYMPRVEGNVYTHLEFAYPNIELEVQRNNKTLNDSMKKVFERELILEDNPRVDSIAESMSVPDLLTNFERVEDVLDLNPRLSDALRLNLGTNVWPLDRVYMSYSGWRREANLMRTLGDASPQWLTFEGKLVGYKSYDGGDYMITVKLEGYNPWHPIEFGKNVMRKMIALSFDQYVETTRYTDIELPLEAKEFQRIGSQDYEPYRTWQRAGTGSAGQGAY